MVGDCLSVSVEPTSWYLHYATNNLLDFHNNHTVRINPGRNFQGDAGIFILNGIGLSKGLAVRPASERNR